MTEIRYHVECAICRVKSPPVETTAHVPEGWATVTRARGETHTTTFQCPAHPEAR